MTKKMKPVSDYAATPITATEPPYGQKSCQNLRNMGWHHHKPALFEKFSSHEEMINTRNNTVAETAGNEYDDAVTLSWHINKKNSEVLVMPN